MKSISYLAKLLGQFWPFFYNFKKKKVGPIFGFSWKYFFNAYLELCGLTRLPGNSEGGGGDSELVEGWGRGSQDTTDFSTSTIECSDFEP
jgi:hypothetical protein